jgi:hypothetical protein
VGVQPAVEQLQDAHLHTRLLVVGVLVLDHLCRTARRARGKGAEQEEGTCYKGLNRQLPETQPGTEKPRQLGAGADWCGRGRGGVGWAACLLKTAVAAPGARRGLQLDDGPHPDRGCCR